MCRQSGKTTTLALRAIWYAVTKPNTTTLLVAPSLRQSTILMDRVIELLHNIPAPILKFIAPKLQRTQLFLSNNSKIYALPCSQHLLRGFTAHQLLADEAAFFKDDESIFYNILLPMFATTSGTLIASSTPWSQDSVFYRFNQEASFSKHHATWRDAVQAGLISQEFIDEQRRLIPNERFQMEYEAEFIEDAEAWLPRALIMQCLDPDLDYIPETTEQQGTFYIGVDLGKKIDHSVIAVLRQDTVNKLIHLQRFPLETPYTTVIGYLKLLTHHLHTVRKIHMDQTGVGEYIVEDTRKALTHPVEGIMLTLQKKEEILSHLKQQMTNQQLTYPYDRDLLNELNTERYELTKDGHIRFHHLAGCYSSDTRVFTGRGLKLFSELSTKDEILTLNPRTNELEYQQPVKIFRYRYSGEMIHFVSRFCDLCVTPNHNMCIKYIDNHKRKRSRLRKTSRPVNVFHFRTADEVAGLRLENVAVPKTGLWRGQDPALFKLPQTPKKTYKKMERDTVPIDLWLRFLGWYLSEGSSDRNGGGYRISIRNQDEKDLEDIAKIVQEMGYHPQLHKRHSVAFRSKRVYDYVHPLGHALQKYIPQEMKDLSPDRLRTLLFHLCKGDGSFNTRGEPKLYITSSPKLAEDVMEIAVKAGYAVGVSTRIGEGFGSPNPNYLVYLSKRTSRGTKLMHSQRINYSGYVYCAEVPNHVMLVERNGRLCFCGNSHDDRLWALALATYATRTPQPFDYEPQLGFGKVPREKYSTDTWASLKKGLYPDH